MSFVCDLATLERLEWPCFARHLAAAAATERGASSILGEDGSGSGLFPETAASVLERLTEVGEIRGLLDAEELPPFGGISDLRPLLERVRINASLTAAEILRVIKTLQGAERLRKFFAARIDRAPLIGHLAATLPELGALLRELTAVIGDDAEVRDGASQQLAKARRNVRKLGSEIDAQMSRILQSPGIQPHLQDSFVTAREGRPVVPVRAEARRRVRGIVHDVSSSGTTVFIEPEAVVEPGNRLRLAQLDVDREIERLLRQLAAAISALHGEIAASGETLAALDRALARAKLSRQIRGTAVLTAVESPLRLLGLRHPLLVLEAGLDFEQAIPNDVVLPAAARGLVISGPNAGGKTVVAKAIGLAALATRAGVQPACGEGSAIPIFDAVYADIGDDQDLRSGLSTFSARMSNLSAIVRGADAMSLVIVDEIGEGTEPGEGAALAQSVLEALVDRGARVVATTHFNRLKELAGSDERFVNASAEFDPATLLPTYRVSIGAPGSSGATWVAERMGLERAVVSRARELLDSEDRKLEALTRNLSELRQELEADRSRAREQREETEAARAEYEARLAVLRSAREKALASMKAGLEDAFKDAREEIASVMRELQSGRSGQAANLAHRTLAEVRERTELVEREHAEPEEAAPAPPNLAGLAVGTRLRIAGISSEALYVEGPDHRDRVIVRIGSARTVLPATRVLKVLGVAPTPRHSHVEERREPVGSGLRSECDLRGLRVDEALDRAEAHLNELIGTGTPSVCFIHGHGTGALREAIRAWLRESRVVETFAAGSRHEGGNGVTVATLAF